jgi:hypothetical protein
VYRTQLVLAVDRLVRDRFLTCEDTQDIVTRLLQAGTSAGVPAPRAHEISGAPDPVPACVGRMRPRYHYHHVFDRDDDDDDRDHDHGRH